MHWSSDGGGDAPIPRRVSTNVLHRASGDSSRYVDAPDVFQPIRETAAKLIVIVALASLATLACGPAWARSPADFSDIDAELEACSDGGTGEGYASVACLHDQTKARVRALSAPDEPHIAR